MKKRVLLLFKVSIIIFLGLFLAQCNNDTEKDNHSILQSESSGYTKITGYIHNRDIYPNTPDMNIDVFNISGQRRVTQLQSPINEDCTFSFEIDLARPQDVAMEPFLKFLYLLPGDSLHIELDFKNLSNVRLSGGKSVEINNDFFKYFNSTGYRTTTGIVYNGVGTDCTMNCSWNEIKKKLDEERNGYRVRRQAFLQENSVCDEVVFLTEAMIELDYYNELTRTMASREITYGKETMSKETLMNEINEVAVKYFDSDFYSKSHFEFISSGYSRAAVFYTRPSTDISYQDWQKETDANFVDWVKNVAKTDIIKDFMFTVRAGAALVQRDLYNFEKCSANIENEYLFDRLMQEYRTTMVKMRNPENISGYILGNPKDFTNIMSSFGEDGNFFVETIPQNYGKVQVINISVSWCAPCKPVLEQLAVLIKEYADKDVSFSFICMSGDNEETRAIYRARGIDDTIVYFTNQAESIFLERRFSPLGFPYGILVNRKGVIVDYGFHVRPGELLSKKIDLLLEQDKLLK